MTDHAQRAKVFKTTVLGLGPWCIEFPDGEIITTHTEERANLIANATQAHAQGRRERLEERDALIDALRWCSGNAFDFGECGDARQGWLNVCQPLLDKYNAQAKEAGHE